MILLFPELIPPLRGTQNGDVRDSPEKELPSRFIRFSNGVHPSQQGGS